MALSAFVVPGAGGACRRGSARLGGTPLLHRVDIKPSILHAQRPGSPLGALRVAQFRAPWRVPFGLSDTDAQAGSAGAAVTPRTPVPVGTWWKRLYTFLDKRIA